MKNHENPIQVVYPVALSAAEASRAPSPSPGDVTEDTLFFGSNPMGVNFPPIAGLPAPTAQLTADDRRVAKSLMMLETDVHRVKLAAVARATLASVPSEVAVALKAKCDGDVIAAAALARTSVVTDEHRRSAAALLARGR